MSPSGNKLREVSSVKALGAVIRERRRALGLTQADLAEQANVGRRFLLELEDGKETVQMGKVIHILAMLGISLKAAVES